MSATFRTVAAALCHEPEPVRGSRFVASVFPTRDRDQAEAAVAQVRQDFAGASHHCFAWRVGPQGSDFRAEDDGEPNHSAGTPILRQVDGRELLDVTVVVTRWFGGTKLGVGGLIRAYGGAAGEALDRAEIETRPRLVPLRLVYSYGDSSTVEAALARYHTHPTDAEYTDLVRRELLVAAADHADFVRALTEATSGRVTVEDTRGR